MPCLRLIVRARCLRLASMVCCQQLTQKFVNHRVHLLHAHRDFSLLFGCVYMSVWGRACHLRLAIAICCCSGIMGISPHEVDDTSCCLALPVEPGLPDGEEEAS